MDEVKIFNDGENYDAYEKTILLALMINGDDGFFSLYPEDIKAYSDSIRFDTDSVISAFSFLNNENEKFKISIGSDDAVKIHNFDARQIDIYKYIFIPFILKKKIRSLSDKTDYDSICQTSASVDSILHLFNMLNRSLGTIHNTDYILHFDKMPYISKAFLPEILCENLKILISCDALDIDYFKLFSIVFDYELKSCLMELHLLYAHRLIIDSPYFDDTIKEIAKDSYDYLLNLLKDARIISLQINHKPLSKTPLSQRTRYDNTTRMQIVYGFPNYDIYTTRLDFMHCGEEFIHFNNSSPGKVSVCLFTTAEKEKLIQKYYEIVDITDCFIEYSGMWALKEKLNIPSSETIQNIYKEIMDSNELKHNSACFLSPVYR